MIAKSWNSLKLLGLGVLLAACTGKKDDAQVIKIGFTPAESTEKVATNGAVFAQLLEKETGFKYQVYVASDYTALIEAMRSNQVQVSWLAPFAFVLAEQKANAKVLFKSVRRGSPHTYSAIVVKNSAPYKTIHDLKGKNIAWTDPSSATGHILPKSALEGIGIDTKTFFGKETWGGSHESVVMAVANGAVDAGATYCNGPEGEGGAWLNYEKNLKGKAEKLRPLWITPPMPSDTVSVSKLFFEDPRFAKVRDGIMKVSKTPEGAAALKELYHIDGIVDAKAEDYEPLRKAAEKLGYDISNKK